MYNDDEDEASRRCELVVTTPSGFKLRLRPMGFDHEGNQLWSQIGQGIAP